MDNASSPYDDLPWIDITKSGFENRNKYVIKTETGLYLAYIKSGNVGATMLGALPLYESAEIEFEFVERI